jgi:hypothetical protein
MNVTSTPTAGLEPTRTEETLVGPVVESVEIPEFANALGSMAASWADRAMVKKPERNLEVLYEEQKPDFVPELLPFFGHPLFVEAPEELRQKVLSCGWLAYNEKTIGIETKVISPACMHIIDGKVPGTRHELVSHVDVDQRVPDNASAAESRSYSDSRF